MSILGIHKINYVPKIHRPPMKQICQWKTYQRKPIGISTRFGVEQWHLLGQRLEFSASDLLTLKVGLGATAMLSEIPKVPPDRREEHEKLHEHVPVAAVWFRTASPLLDMQVDANSRKLFYQPDTISDLFLGQFLELLYFLFQELFFPERVISKRDFF